MKCFSCGHLLPDDSKFCHYCGKKIENKLSVEQNKKCSAIPILDFNALAFADEETIQKAQEDYANKMVLYVSKRIAEQNNIKTQKQIQKKNTRQWYTRLILITLIVIACMIGGFAYYYVDASPNTISAPVNKSNTVYITKTGTKYHKSNCTHLTNSSKSISLDKAKSRGYAPCSRCY